MFSFLGSLNHSKSMQFSFTSGHAISKKIPQLSADFSHQHFNGGYKIAKEERCIVQ